MEVMLVLVPLKEPVASSVNDPALAHFSPVASPEAAVKTVPLAPTPKRASTVEKVKISPFVVNGV